MKLFNDNIGKALILAAKNKKAKYIEIEVEDTGTGKNKMKAAALQKLFEERRESGYVFTGIRGRGLVKIIGEWTDEIHFADRPEGGLAITVRKYVKDVRKSETLPNPNQPITVNL